jgi:hypothetical protein
MGFRSTSRTILLGSLPLAFVLQVLVLVTIGLAQAPFEDIICTASVHGSRAVPCSFWQLLGESIVFTFWMNLFTLGATSLAAYLACVIGWTLISDGLALLKDWRGRAGKDAA